MQPWIGVVALTLALAAANGANDVSKGVATLAGAGVTRYRTAVLWGATTTFVGALISSSFAERMNTLFSRGIVTTPPTMSFAMAVLAGALAWVGIATLARLPVSTTHAIVGALIGAGVQPSPGAVNWSVLLTGVTVPLLASVVVSYLLSIALSFTSLGRPECVCVGVICVTPGVIDAGGAVVFAPDAQLPVLTVRTGTTQECRAHGLTVGRLRVTQTGATG
jgi:phosphate/sulfate permease